MSYKQSTYNEDSDADDEYERSVITSPTLPADFESSPTDSGSPSTEHTPTTFTHGSGGSGSHVSPKGSITQWSAEQCADYVSSLGLSQYADAFIEEAITGDALIAILQEDLKEMGVGSLGHRLTILKGVYDLKKKQNVPIEPDHFVPLSAEHSGQDSLPTQDDIARIIKIIKDRDERIITAEAELRMLREDLSRIHDENKRLREDILPMARMAKNNSQPLPDPEHDKGSGLGRKFSTKKLYLSSAPKNPSPTMQDGRTLTDGSSLDPSAAAMAASTHLTAQMRDGSQTSPSHPQPSPTSPGYSMSSMSSVPPARSRHNAEDHSTSTYSNWSTASTVVPDRRRGTADDPPLSGGSNTGNSLASSTASATSTLAGNPLATPSAGIIPTVATPSVNGLSSSTGTGTSTGRDRERSDSRSDGAGSGGGGNPQVEIFKSFRVSIDDPCHKVLPVALKKYNITADWRQYALYIVHGDQERCLGLNEKPLILFKQLDREGRKPMFMLRKHAQPVEGHVNVVGQGQSMGGGLVGQAPTLPGGVL